MTLDRLTMAGCTMAWNLTRNRWPSKGGVCRHVMVHGHMFKNAGSTLDWSLRRSFGDAFLDHRNDEKMKQGARYLGALLSSRRNLKAISSHYLPLPLSAIPNINLTIVLLFRNPIERALSVYEFERRQGVPTLGAINAKRLSFAQYIEWRLAPASPPVLRNFQVRYCVRSINAHIAPMSDKDLYLAINFLERSDEVISGVVEQYADSMICFESTLVPSFPTLDLAYKKQNVGIMHSLSGEEKNDYTKRQLGQTLYNRFLENNLLDMELHRIAGGILAAQRDRLTNFQLRREQFLARCAALY